MDTPKIAFIGNQGNNAFKVSRWLRERGLDITLFLLSKRKRSLPDYVDVSLNGNYPDWIDTRLYSDFSPRKSILFDSAANRYICRKFDIAVTFGSNALFLAPFLKGIPVVHYSLGTEITQYPFLRLTGNPGALLKRLLFRFYSRRAIRSLNKILGGWPMFYNAIDSLGVVNKTIFINEAEDVKNKSLVVNLSLLENLNLKYSGYSKVFLWLSRLNFKDPQSMSYKAADVFLRAFARVAREHSDVRAIVGEHGGDVNAFKQIAKEENIEDRIEYVPHLPYWKLLTYLSIDNGVVFDMLGKTNGEIGGLGREALSVGSVVVQSFNKDFNDIVLGPGCPVINADSVETCEREMARLREMDKADFIGLKEKITLWVEKNLDYRNNYSVRKLEYIIKEEVHLYNLVRCSR